MSESTSEPRHSGFTFEKPVKAVLASARPLPNGDEMVIDDLTDDEERQFFEAIRQV